MIPEVVCLSAGAPLGPPEARAQGIFKDLPDDGPGEGDEESEGGVQEEDGDGREDPGEEVCEAPLVENASLGGIVRLPGRGCTSK